MRDYFLSERHECNPKSSMKCLMCEVARIFQVNLIFIFLGNVIWLMFYNYFQEFYSGSRGPLSLYRLLHLIWNHARHLAAYEQQDAHEFFIATLNMLHNHCTNSLTDDSLKDTISSSAKVPSNSNECKCIINQVILIEWFFYVSVLIRLCFRYSLVDYKVMWCAKHVKVYRPLLIRLWIFH